MADEKILVVEDEKDISKLLKYNLEKEGYGVTTCYDGESALAMCRREKPDLAIVDVMLPKMDGYEFCRNIRRESDVPILFVTARKEEVDRILGLEMGADDYITKPFSLREVMARIKAVLRRYASKKTPRAFIRMGDLVVDLDRYEVRVKGKPVAISPKEFDFLKCLVQAEGKAVSREDLLGKVWKKDREINHRTIDQHIARLRSRLGDQAQRIMTVKNVGYRLRMD
jgi:DNA-binding response OmpR family regulator